MATLTFASKLNADNCFTIPQEAVETLGLPPGDEINVRIETRYEVSLSDGVEQAELHRKASVRFQEAYCPGRETGKPLTLPMKPPGLRK